MLPLENRLSPVLNSVLPGSRLLLQQGERIIGRYDRRVFVPARQFDLNKQINRPLDRIQQTGDVT